MNGKFIATRTTQLTTMLINLSNNFSETNVSFTTEELAAVQGAAYQIAAIENTFTAKNDFDEALKPFLAAMSAKLKELGGIQDNDA